MDPRAENRAPWPVEIGSRSRPRAATSRRTFGIELVEVVVGGGAAVVLVATGTVAEAEVEALVAGMVAVADRPIVLPRAMALSDGALALCPGSWPMAGLDACCR